ncbi:TetR family transcriptional regulator [Arcanobacterium haemolyticum]|nr:TetR family transcriptional regulator [Arcanobacterium haemolyticum]
MSESPAPRRNPRRDPETTRREILDAATAEFADKGPLGGRIDVIASQTNTSKRMIYYYFGSKAGLYKEVLIESYERIRRREIDLRPETLEPEAALRILTRETLQHFERNTEAVRIIAYENLQYNGQTILDTPRLFEVNERAVTIVDDILARGRETGVFRDGPDAPTATDVHQVLSALALNRIEHQSSFRILFDRDMLGESESAYIRQMIEDTVLRFVLKNPRD